MLKKFMKTRSKCTGTYWTKERGEKGFCYGMFVDPSKKGQLAFMPVSASGGMERFADFAPLSLPKIQHFCFLFAILSHKLISILQKMRVCQKSNTFAFAILPLQSISIFGETIMDYQKLVCTNERNKYFSWERVYEITFKEC